MNTEISFKKNRIFFGILFSTLMLVLSISFLINPEVFIRNKFMKIWLIQTLGVIGGSYYLALLYSFLNILSRKFAIRISNESLIDHSKYESVGEINWENIAHVQRYKKRSVEITLQNNRDVIGQRNLIKRFLTVMHNWNYKKSIIISSALIDCTTEELFLSITEKKKK